MSTNPVLKIWAVCLAFQLLAPQAFAADTLQADLVQQGPRARTAAPIPVDARLNWSGTRILEGRLEMEFHDGNRVVGRYRSGEMGLTTGEQRFRMLLPSVPAPFSDPQLEVRMRFVTGAGTFALEPSVVFVPMLTERSLVVGWCGARAAAGEQAMDIQRSLLFERLSPPSTDAPRRSLATSLTRLVPEDLPTQPLAYTPYDIVVLSAEAFAAAREGQLQALARWVKGGGSVCIFVGGELQPYHLDFLNDLAGATLAGPAFLAGSDGSLLPGPKKITRLYSGVGRTVVVTGDIAREPGLDSAAWRGTVAFLWKARAGQVLALAETGHWQVSSNELPENLLPQTFEHSPQARERLRQLLAQRRANPYAAPAQYSVQSSDLGSELVNRLMPQTVRLIPFAALVGILVLFLVVIGPVDYFGLGLLRRRRYTWVLFPATSLAFTVVTVLMANYYLGVRDERRSLIVVDVGSDGAALRWNRFELIFAARDKQSVTELKDALWSPLDFRSAPEAAFYPGYQYSRRDPEHEAAPPVYDGVVPVHFQASQLVRQWRPELARTFSFAPPPVPVLPNWRDVEAAWPDLAAIRAKLSAAKPFAGDLCVMSGFQPAELDRSSRGILSVPILEKLWRNDPTGPLSLVFQVSPTGSGNFEDLGGGDPEADTSVLAIVTEAGNDIVVYRRFFHGN